ncbi:hypothetical protein TcG_12062, partial [Trypanosoma cruzi]
LHVRCVVAAVFWPFPWGCGNELGEMVVDVFFSCMVGGCWRCVPSLRGCRLVVCELCGWACCPLLMLSALSRCIRCAPSLSLPFHSFSFCLTDQLTPATPLRAMMTAMMTMVTVRLRVVCAVQFPAFSCCCCCNSVCVTAAGGGNDSHTIASTPEGSRGTTTSGSTGLGSGAEQSQGASGVERPQG